MTRPSLALVLLAGLAAGCSDRDTPTAPRAIAKPAFVYLAPGTVAQVSADRSGTVSVALDNGQTWTFKDEDMRLKSGDRVTIRRAAFGSFLMTTPARQTHRVQRTQ